MLKRPRQTSSFLVSLALHLVLGVVLVRTLTFGPLDRLFDDDPTSAPVERIGFVALPQEGPPQSGISGGDNRPERPKPETPALVAPAAVPTGVPEAPAAPVVDREEGGSGPLVGRGGPLAGIRPSFSEPRVWVPPAPIVSAPKTMPERLDSALSARIAAHEDSLKATAAARAAPGDWTWEKGGKKYGWDAGGIQLGDKTIPAALLSMLAVNMQMVTAEQNARTPDRLMRDRWATEVRAYGQRNVDYETFQKTVKAIRERKDRERREAEASRDVPPPASR